MERWLSQQVLKALRGTEVNAEDAERGNGTGLTLGHRCGAATDADRALRAPSQGAKAHLRLWRADTGPGGPACGGGLGTGTGGPYHPAHGLDRHRGSARSSFPGCRPADPAAQGCGRQWPWAQPPAHTGVLRAPGDLLASAADRPPRHPVSCPFTRGLACPPPSMCLAAPSLAGCCLKAVRGLAAWGGPRGPSVLGRGCFAVPRAGLMSSAVSVAPIAPAS